MIIYKATNLINNKVYIGQTNNLKVRNINRKNKVLKGFSNIYFDNAIRKYGWDNFRFEEIDFCDNQEETDYMEDYWIKFYNSMDKKYGYNMTRGGMGKSGYKITEETRNKLIQSHKGQIAWNKGKTNIYSSDVLKKISERNKGKHFSIKTEFKKGIAPWNKGVSPSKETVRKIIESKTGIPSKKRKKVICIETNKIYNSVTEAEKITGFCHISGVCRNERKLAGTFHWKYIEENKND